MACVSFYLISKFWYWEVADIVVFIRIKFWQQKFNYNKRIFRHLVCYDLQKRDFTRILRRVLFNFISYIPTAFERLFYRIKYVIQKLIPEIKDPCIKFYKLYFKCIYLGDNFCCNIIKLHNERWLQCAAKIDEVISSDLKMPNSYWIICLENPSHHKKSVLQL